MLLAYPIVGRAGLGNMLFPWARAEIFARQHRTGLIRPVWNTVRIGPYLRREPLKRHYVGYFNHADHIGGLGRLTYLARGRWIEETRAGELDPHGLQSKKLLVVIFRGLADYFTPLRGEQVFIRARLWQMTRHEFRPSSAAGRPFIAMHIRRGDLTRMGLPSEQIAQLPQITPIDWFVAMAHAVRRHKQLDAVPIIVFTDGSDEEVSEVLRVDGVRLYQSGAAIADLWALSGASLLFASGFSTFSMWASYLGGMPTIYAPGKIQQRVQEGLQALEIELDADANPPAEAYCRLGSVEAHHFVMRPMAGCA